MNLNILFLNRSDSGHYYLSVLHSDLSLWVHRSSMDFFYGHILKL